MYKNIYLAWGNKNFFLKNPYEELLNQSRNFQVYSHNLFYSHCRIYKPFFNSIPNYLIFLRKLAHGSGIRRTQNVFVKNIQQDLPNQFENHHVHSHEFLILISVFTCFFRNFSNSLNFLCVSAHCFDVRSIKNVSKKTL